MIPLPQISVDSMTYLKPELIGLAAWLGMHPGLYSGDRAKVLAHVATTGTLAGLSGCVVSDEDLANAAAAHSDWLDYLAAIDPTPKARPIVFHRNGNGNGHISRLDARLQELADDAGVNGQESPDDVAF